MRLLPYTERAMAERLNQKSELTCRVASTCRMGAAVSESVCKHWLTSCSALSQVNNSSR
jgi:hypothetical protein